MDTMALFAVMRMGPPPRSLAAEANDCFMVRVFVDPPNTRLRRNAMRPKAGSPRFDACGPTYKVVTNRSTMAIPTA